MTNYGYNININLPFQTRTAIAGCFNPEGRTPTTPSIKIGLNRNELYQRAFIINPKYNESFFIPTFALIRVIEHIRIPLSYASSIERSILYPMRIVSKSEKSSADSASRILLKGKSKDAIDEAVKVSVGKSVIVDYIGMRGAIFDAEWNPLMLCGSNAVANKLDGTLTLVQPVCYIHPKVFVEDTVMNRFILKKIIPIFIDNTVVERTRGLSEAVSVNRDMEVKMLIEDASHMVYTPRKPDFSTTRDINNLLANYNYGL